jgi:membrane associated rhomboid family serine protease
VAPTDGPGLLDRLVRLLAGAMNALGLNGTRVLWKWNRRAASRAEAGARREVFWRSARGRHKMCPSCRALVARGASRCSECGASLAGVSAPGVGRLLGNLLPGITAATSLIMLVNGFWFVMMIMARIRAGGGGGLLGGFGGEMLVRFGAGLNRAVELSNGDVTGGEWWRLITPVFLHAGLLHFFFNSYLLLHLGPIAEEIYGTVRYWVVYLLSGIAGSVVSQVPTYPAFLRDTEVVISIGASGAIMGLIGLLLVCGLRGKGILGQSMKGLMLRLFFYSVIMSFFFNIDHFAHAGGFACGALAGLVVPQGQSRGAGAARVWQVLSFAGVLLVLYAFYQVAAQGRLSAGG